LYRVSNGDHPFRQDLCSEISHAQHSACICLIDILRETGVVTFEAPEGYFSNAKRAPD
jgi:hypothetical protein